MSANNILDNKSATEIADSVRRLINDLDSNNPAIQDHMLREMVIAEFIAVSHEVGWDPSIPTRPSTGASMLSYNLAAGDYQTTQEPESDVIASSEVWINRSSQPLQFVPRTQLEGWINRDLFVSGAVLRGLPKYWTIRIDQTADGASTAAQMQHRMLVYPAADVATTVYWPRTVVDTENVDPTSTTGRPRFSYQLTFALENKLAAICVRAMHKDSLDRLRIDRGYAESLWNHYQNAIETERAERAAHVLCDGVRPLMV